MGGREREGSGYRIGCRHLFFFKAAWIKAQGLVSSFALGWTLNLTWGIAWVGFEWGFCEEISVRGLVPCEGVQKGAGDGQVRAVHGAISINSGGWVDERMEGDKSLLEGLFFIQG